MNNFRSERVIVTLEAFMRLSRRDVNEALNRHTHGDWGELQEGVAQTVDDAARRGGRLISVYRATDGTLFWIVTEANRSLTTVLIPEAEAQYQVSVQ